MTPWIIHIQIHYQSIENNPGAMNMIIIRNAIIINLVISIIINIIIRNNESKNRKSLIKLLIVRAEWKKYKNNS